MTGNLIIVSAPSGTGKTTLIKDIIKRDSGVRSAVSYTSRSTRAGEVEGVSYHFVTREVFKQMIEQGDLLEWAEVHGNLYGTSRRMVDEWRAAGFDVILTIDVQGAESVRITYPEAIGIFIFPPSYKDLISRLSARDGSSSRDLALRMQNALTEISQYHKFDYVVINDNLDRATEELAAIILAERCRIQRRTKSVDKILQTFFNNQSKGE